MWERYCIRCDAYQQLAAWREGRWEDGCIHAAAHACPPPARPPPQVGRDEPQLLEEYSCASAQGQPRLLCFLGSFLGPLLHATATGKGSHNVHLRLNRLVGAADVHVATPPNCAASQGPEATARRSHSSSRARAAERRGRSSSRGRPGKPRRHSSARSEAADATPRGRRRHRSGSRSSRGRTKRRHLRSSSPEQVLPSPGADSGLFSQSRSRSRGRGDGRRHCRSRSRSRGKGQRHRRQRSRSRSRSATRRRSRGSGCARGAEQQTAAAPRGGAAGGVHVSAPLGSRFWDPTWVLEHQAVSRLVGGPLPLRELLNTCHVPRQLGPPTEGEGAVPAAAAAGPGAGPLRNPSVLPVRTSQKCAVANCHSTPPVHGHPVGTLFRFMSARPFLFRFIGLPGPAQLVEAGQGAEAWLGYKQVLLQRLADRADGHQAPRMWAWDLPRPPPSLPPSLRSLVGRLRCLPPPPLQQQQQWAWLLLHSPCLPLCLANPSPPLCSHPAGHPPAAAVGAVS